MIGDLLAGVCAELQMHQCEHVEMDKYQLLATLYWIVYFLFVLFNTK